MIRKASCMIKMGSGVGGASRLANRVSSGRWLVRSSVATDERPSSFSAIRACSVAVCV